MEPGVCSAEQARLPRGVTGARPVFTAGRLWGMERGVEEGTVVVLVCTQKSDCHGLGCRPVFIILVTTGSTILFSQIDFSGIALRHQARLVKA